MSETQQQHINSQADSFEAFDYVNLADVDPTFKPIPQAVYSLEVSKTEIKEYTRKKDDKRGAAGTAGKRLALTLVVVDDDTFSGRRVFVSLFPDEFTQRALRRIQDATGHVQEPGQTLSAWFESLGNLNPKARFRTLVEVTKNRQNGDDQNDVRFRTVEPYV